MTTFCHANLRKFRARTIFVHTLGKVEKKNFRGERVYTTQKQAFLKKHPRFRGFQVHRQLCVQRVFRGEKNKNFWQLRSPRTQSQKIVIFLHFFCLACTAFSLLVGFIYPIFPQIWYILHRACTNLVHQKCAKLSFTTLVLNPRFSVFFFTTEQNRKFSKSGFSSIKTQFERKKKCAKLTRTRSCRTKPVAHFHFLAHSTTWVSGVNWCDRASIQHTFLKNVHESKFRVFFVFFLIIFSGN